MWLNCCGILVLGRIVLRSKRLLSIPLIRALEYNPEDRALCVCSAAHGWKHIGIEMGIWKDQWEDIGGTASRTRQEDTKIEMIYVASCGDHGP